MHLRRLVVVSFALSMLAACGSSGPAAVPNTADRESGQSRLMDKTFAGSHGCDPKSQNRPFIIEWDATDMSSFESHASSDVVVVKYEGCDLRVLEGCAPSIKGSLGAYGAVEWTSGSVEKIDIGSEGELYAKLPLGVGQLGGRVSAGEQFHMEYYVSGTRNLTRQAVYSKELAKIPSCEGATHFVAGYNLGAFALGSRKNIRGEAGATVWGIGAGGSKSSMSNAEKKGGVLTACTGDSAREAATCKVPIRLTLRAITDGDNPDVAEAQAPDTSAAMNLAGKVDQKIRLDDAAKARIDAALQKHRAGDGPGCLKELDAYDKVNRIPSQQSTNPHFYYSQVRAQCVMMSGRCDAGKAQLRKSTEALMGQKLGPAQIDTAVEYAAAQYCRGSLSPREQLLAAKNQLDDGAHQRKLDAEVCKRAWGMVKSLSQTVKPKDEEDSLVQAATNLELVAPTAALCLGRAGNCDAAYEVEREYLARWPSPARMQMFESNVPLCKGKVVVPLTPREELEGVASQLSQASVSGADSGTCSRGWEKYKRLLASLPAQDPTVQSAQQNTPLIAQTCMVRAGDCSGAFRVYFESYVSQITQYSRVDPSRYKPEMLRPNFEMMWPACKGR
jgi:hypothetical protein